MGSFDYRTKPEDHWTYYVVDNLPTMSNIYRFDTAEEALAKYKELPRDLRTAIGASINGTSELDLIHRRVDNIPVLVTDFLHPKNEPIWRESRELQNSIDLMIVELGVQYQSDFGIFGPGYPSVCIELERYESRSLDPYFANKQLRLNDKNRLSPRNQFLSSIDEVFAVGKGWMNASAFLSYLDDSRPGTPGEASRDVFVSMININYKTPEGSRGQADISPREFKMLRDKTEREMTVAKKPVLDQKISAAELVSKNQASQHSHGHRGEREH